MSQLGTEYVTLEVTGPQAEEVGSERRRVFGTRGGTIGRAPSNDWVLADPYVSSRHAAIQFRDGTFFIEDLNSRNGVFVNNQRLDAGRPCPLQDGDLVFIEPYELAASIGTAAHPPAIPGLAAAVPLPPLPAASDSDFEGLVEPGAVSGDDDWLNRLAPADETAVRLPRPDISDLARDVLQEAVRPPVARAAAAVPPTAEDYDPIADIRGPYRTDAPSPSPAAQSSLEGGDRHHVDRRHRTESTRAPAPGNPAGTVDLAALLAGAGLNGVALAPDVAAQLGQILRVVVDGLLDVLKSRQEIKDEFRIRHTVMQRRGNNPLKFAADVEDALHNLLVKKNPGYLGPVAAFEDAFADVRRHQAAMLAGMRDAFEHMLAQFDPDRLQQEFNRHTPRRGGLQVLQGKPDYWEFYREFVQRLASDADERFRTLFGDEFAKAYERQLNARKDDGHRERPARGAEER